MLKELLTSHTTIYQYKPQNNQTKKFQFNLKTTEETAPEGAQLFSVIFFFHE